MSIKLCRTFAYRNSSVPFSPSNQLNISDAAEWITNSISLIIFVLAFIGNTAALIVMFGSRGPIRITNNKYLANLACADLLRACFMPFTIIARMKKNFMFGSMICKILPIVQGTSFDRENSIRQTKNQNLFCFDWIIARRALIYALKLLLGTFI
jgi:hypothetical protein